LGSLFISKKINSNRFSSFWGKKNPMFHNFFKTIKFFLIKNYEKKKKKKKKKALDLFRRRLVSTIWSRPNMKQATAIPMVTKAAGRKEGRTMGVVWCSCMVCVQDCISSS
jgi:hypothetical protein